MHIICSDIYLFMHAVFKLLICFSFSYHKGPYMLKMYTKKI